MRTDLTIDDIQKLVVCWKYHAEPQVNPVPIELMVCVGMKMEPIGDMRFMSALDDDLMQETVDLLGTHARRFSPALRVKHLNADPIQGGLDFFDHQESAEVLLLANLFWPGETYRSFNPDCYISPHCKSLPDIVAKAESLNVKYIFTKSCGVSVSVKAFEEYGPYQVIHRDGVNVMNNLTATGFAVHRDVIPSLRADAYTAAL